MSDERPAMRTVELPTTCPYCHGEATATYGEFTIHLRWGDWLECSSCGVREHGSGWDEPREAFDFVRPSVARDAMLAEYGEWALVLEQPPSVVFLQALRSIFDLSLEELKQEKAQLPGIVRRGTRNRIEYLEARLREWGCRDIMTLTRL